MCNLSLEIEHLLDKETMDRTIELCVHEVMDVFYRPELGLVVENVLTNNQLSDSFEGRHLNPGHAIEAMWFIMDLGVRLNRPDLIQKATDISLKMIRKGWDEKYGGFSISWIVWVIRLSNWSGTRSFGGYISNR